MDKAVFTAVITAAGRGTRMGSDIPKQYMPILNKPVIYYSLRAFDQSSVDSLVITCAPGDEDFVYESIVKAFDVKKPCKVVAGGQERYLSVRNGVMAAEDADYVMIHDAARPLVDQGLIKRCMDAVRTYDACVPAVPVTDTVKTRIEGGYAGETADRNLLAAIQTPQCFRRSLLVSSYEKVGKMNIDPGRITDDASVVELAGLAKVKLVDGLPSNRKITTREDLLFAAAVLKEWGEM